MKSLDLGIGGVLAILDVSRAEWDPYCSYSQVPCFTSGCSNEKVDIQESEPFEVDPLNRLMYHPSRLVSNEHSISYNIIGHLSCALKFSLRAIGKNLP